MILIVRTTEGLGTAREGAQLSTGYPKCMQQPISRFVADRSGQILSIAAPNASSLHASTCKLTVVANLYNLEQHQDGQANSIKPLIECSMS